MQEMTEKKCTCCSKYCFIESSYRINPVHSFFPPIFLPVRNIYDYSKVPTIIVFSDVSLLRGNVITV